MKKIKTNNETCMKKNWKLFKKFFFKWKNIDFIKYIESIGVTNSVRIIIGILIVWFWFFELLFNKCNFVLIFNVNNFEK